MLILILRIVILNSKNLSKNEMLSQKYRAHWLSTKTLFIKIKITTVCVL